MLPIPSDNEPVPLVSVIIPTFNRANLVSRAIKSVLDQNFKDFELIIVDDGSTDNTKQVIADFNDERIIYYKQTVNKGQNASLNLGVGEAKGKFLAFLDSDDEWLPDFLEKMLSAFNHDQTLGAVYSRACGCSSKGILTIGYQFHLQGDVYKEVLEQGYLSYMITIMVKKEFIDLLKPNPFDPTFVYGQDDDFCFRVAKMCRIGLISEPLAIIHADGGINGGEPSICSKADLIAEGRQKLLDKYKEDILKYCGLEILAKKYLSLAKLYLRSGNIEKARFSCNLSFKIKKSYPALLYIIYCRVSFIRCLGKIATDTYRFVKNMMCLSVKVLYPTQGK
jgi:glycosyltransferase involved in cell wall biosynthesis